MDQAKEITGGAGFDYVFETAGNTITMKMAFELAANKAQVCFVGTPTKELTFTVKECIKRGICKVNYATDLRIAFTKGVKRVLDEKPDTIDPKKYNAEGRKEVKEYVMSKILVCGSNGKA